MAVTGSRTELGQTLKGQNRPAAHHRKCHFRMELEAIGLFTIAEGLRLEILALGQEGWPLRQIKTFPMPLIDVVGERAFADAMPVFRRMDGIIANFHTALRVAADAVTEMAREHLGAKTNAKKRRVFLEWNSDPVYFAAQPGVFVVHAHRTAENDHTGIILQCFRKRIAERGTPAIELASLGVQKTPEPPGRGMFLMQDDKNPAPKVGTSWHCLAI